MQQIVWPSQATGKPARAFVYTPPDYDKNTAHEFLTWRRSLHAFAPLLFRN